MILMLLENLQSGVREQKQACLWYYSSVIKVYVNAQCGTTQKTSSD